MTFQLHYNADTETYTHTQLKENLSFALTTFLNYGIDGLTTTNQDNFKVDLFGSDTATYLQFMEYDSGNDYYECMDTSDASLYYVIIEATALTPGDFEVYDCLCLPFASGKWILYCNNDANYEVNRAKVFKSLFWNGSTSNIIASATSVTAIKTMDNADVGYKGWYVKQEQGWSGNWVGTGIRTGTFSSTSGNEDVSQWAICEITDSDGGNATVSWYLDTGDVRTSVNTSTATKNDDTEIATTEVDNPADCKIVIARDSAGSPTGKGTAEVMILTKSHITWASTGDAIATKTEYNFFNTGSIPALTAVTESDLSCALTVTPATITTAAKNVITKYVDSLTAGNSITVEASFDGGTHWQTITHKELAKIVYRGTSLMLRFTLTRANDSEQDSITSYGCYYG